MRISDIFRTFLSPNGKTHFLSSLSPDASVLDVGCGNNSPYRVKRILPNCNYTGIDVSDYNQTKPIQADAYILTTAEKFAEEIGNLSGRFDAVVSSHNLEHCDEREKTLAAMLSALKVGGKIFLAFPSEKSVNFPNRGGTLNYYDDDTHKSSPPNFDDIIKKMKNSGFELNFSKRHYSPKILWVIGLITEPLSRYRNKNMMGTWAYYGFESIVIATKTKQL